MRKRTGTGPLSIPDPEENHIADLIPLIPDLIRDLLRKTRERLRLGGRNERSSESRVKLAWAMPSRDDIAESNEG